MTLLILPLIKKLAKRSTLARISIQSFALLATHDTVVVRLKNTWKKIQKNIKELA